MELASQSIGIGLVISLFFSHTLGITAGGMVVPGYIALMIHHPLRIIGTIGVALITLFTLRIISNFMFIYGTRRLVFAILLGFVYGELSRRLLVIPFPQYTLEIQSIGYIIPGLIANWMERQGIIQTLCAMLVASVFVKLLLILLTGGKIIIL